MPTERLVSDEAPIPRTVLAQAADWLLRLQDATDGDRAAHEACERWCQQHPDHARAWERAQHLLGLVGRIPAGLALPVLGRPQDRRRRAAVKRLGMWLTLAPAGWLGWELMLAAPPGDALRTAVGERVLRTLPDGTALILDTDTRVLLQFDGHHRQLRLVRGQLRVTTAPDTHAPSRPLQVVTTQGQVRALGTRFDVRVDGDRTQVALFEGSLEIRAGSRPPWRLQAGEQAWFGTDTGPTRAALDETAAAWTRGMLIADAQPLQSVLAQLARHRRGLVRCDPDVAGLLVSGAFPLDDTDRSLAMLEATYPVRVQHVAGRLWVTVAAR
jgi:transmembrane sensor